eukprot:9484892-Pyramimonas_sp.AAC.1
MRSRHRSRRCPRWDWPLSSSQKGEPPCDPVDALVVAGPGPVDAGMGATDGHDGDQILSNDHRPFTRRSPIPPIPFSPGGWL